MSAEIKLLAWGNVTRHAKTADLGAHAVVHAGGKWQARYTIASHGKGPSAVADELDAIAAHHAEWSTRLEVAHAGIGEDFAVGLDIYRVVDFTIPACRPGQRCRVVVGVRKVEGDILRRVPGFPMTFTYAALSSIPENTVILDEVRAVLESRAAAEVAHVDFTGRVEALLAERKSERV